MKKIEFEIINFKRFFQKNQNIANNKNMKNNSFKEKKNNNNKPFYCKKCNSILNLSLSYDKSKEEIFINLACKNNHKECLKVSEFLKIYKSYQIRNFNCPNINCKMVYDSNNNLLICGLCNKIICIKCYENHCREQHPTPGNMIKDKKIIIKPFNTFKSCCDNYFEYDYFCYKCRKYFCKNCYRDQHEKHGQVNFKKKYIEIKKEFNEDINRDYKNKKKYLDNILNQTKINLFVIENYKKNLCKIRKLLVNSYENNNNIDIGNNYDFFNKKNLYNTQKVDLNIKKLINYFKKYEKIQKEKGGNNSKGENHKKDMEVEEEKKYNNNILNYSNNILEKYFNEKKEEKIKIINPTFKEKIEENNKIDNNINNNIYNFRKNTIFNNINNNKEDKNNNYFDINNIYHENIKKNNKKSSKSKNKEIKKDERGHSVYMAAPLCNENENKVNNIYNNNNYYYNLEIDKSFKNNNDDMDIDNNNIINNISNDNKNNLINNNNYNITEQKFEYKINKILIINNNYIILSFDKKYNNILPNLRLYKIKKDNNSNKIHPIVWNFPKELFSDFNKFPDDTLLLCSNKNIKKIKILYYENFNYKLLYNRTIKNEKLLNSSYIELCTPLKNYNFITYGANKSLNIWKKRKNIEEYLIEKIEIKCCQQNFEICDIKEITNDLIVINSYKQKIDNDFTSYIIYLEINKNKIIDLDKRTRGRMKLSKDKNSIKVINDNYFSISLYEGGCIIIKTNSRIIVKKISDIFYLNQIRLLGGYIYYFDVKKNNINSGKYEYKHYKIKNFDNFLKIIPKYEKKVCLETIDKINDFEVVILNNEVNNLLQRIRIVVLLIVGEKIIIINYYT